MKKDDESPYVNPALLEMFGGTKSKLALPKTKAVHQNKAKQLMPIRATGKPRAKANSKRLRETLAFRIIAISSIVILALLIFSPITDIVSEKVEESHASEAIKDIGSNSGFNFKGKVLFYGAHPELVNADSLDSVCPSGDGTDVEFGCYLPSENKIYILEVPDPTYKEVEYTTAAHETLHAAWHKLSDYERGHVAGLIDKVYKDTASQTATQLSDELKSYGSDEATVYSELHSFIGSEYDVSSLNSDLAIYYSKYFSNQTVPVNDNTAFNNDINTEISHLDDEYNQIDALSNSIDTYKAQHLDNIKAAMNYDDYIGDYYTYNKNVDAFNHNLVYYNGQVATYNSRRDSYNAEVDRFNAVLKAFYPTRTLIKLFSQ